MSAVVLAGLELTSGAEPTAIVTEDSELPKSAICHITRATLVPTGTATTPATFYLKASISDSQDIVLAAVNTAQPSVGLDLVFHADSTPLFSVTSVPELKGDAKQKFTVHLSGYVDVELDEDDMGDDDDDEDGDELSAEEMAAMRQAFKRGKLGEDGEDEDDDEQDEEDDEAALEGEEEGEGEDEEEDEMDEEEEKQAAPAPAKKGAAVAAATAAGKKRKEAPAKTAASAPAAKQQKTAAATPTQSASTKQAKPDKQKPAAPTTTAAASSPSATILPSGLTIQDEVVGTGAEANNGRKVSIRYKGQLVSNGKVFDTNMPKGRPFMFTLGGDEVIQGFNKGVKGMRVGGRRVIVVPSELGYGKRGDPPTIPPNAALKFTVELIKV